MKLNELVSAKTLAALYTVGTAVNIVSLPGMGKSSVTREFPRILSQIFGEEFGYHEELVPSLDAPDVRGFMVPTKLADGGVVSQYTYPAILPSREYLAAHPRGVIFFDEFAQADMLTQKSLAPMILEGAVGNYRLPPGWMRVTASNRMQDRSGVGKALMHVVNRQTTVEIEPCVDTWVNWASDYVHPVTGRKLHPLAIAFAKRFPQVLFGEMPAESKPFCTPRSFVAAWNLITTMCDVDADGYVAMTLPKDSVMWQFVAGSVGEAASAQMQAFAKVADEIPTIQEILRSPDTAKVPRESRLDAAFAVVQMCMHYLDQKNLKPVWTYLVRLPRELQVSVANQIMANAKLSGHLMGSPDFTKWLTQNTALLQQSNS